MNRKKKFVAYLLVLAGMVALSACSQSTSEESELPWSQPASWEGGLPGFGGRY